MDERYNELIDKYLRKEMSPEESLRFKQDALSCHELKKEIELTYRIKRNIINRQKKLSKIVQWERKKKIMVTSVTAIFSIAAMLVIGFFITKPVLDVKDMNNNPIASSPIYTSPRATADREKAIVAVKNNISKGMEEEAIAEVNRLEEQNIIPALNDVSKGKLLMNQYPGLEDAEVLGQEAYELHWLKIKSLIAIEKTNEAVKLLKAFVQIDGKYKADADSLLQTLD